MTRIERKPKGVGYKLKDCADADTKAILQLEIQEGADVMGSKEYMAEYKLVGQPSFLGGSNHGMSQEGL